MIISVIKGNNARFALMVGDIYNLLQLGLMSLIPTPKWGRSRKSHDQHFSLASLPLL